jgi:hypothetical protein
MPMVPVVLGLLRRASAPKAIAQLGPRIPFTLLLLVLLASFGVYTDTVAHWIQPRWVAALGFAPVDWWPPSAWRVFASALVTTGSRAFWEAVVMVALAVGACEWLAGTATTVGAFWGIQILTLGLESLVLAVAAGLSGTPATVGALSQRTVGASIGFVGCLGVVLGRVDGRLGRALTLVTLACLAGLFFLPYPAQSVAVKLSDDLAHLVAFPLGWLAGWRGSRTVAASAQGSASS